VCDCSAKVEELQEQLAESRKVIDTLSTQVKEHLPPFCEDSFINDDFTQTHTGLPNLRTVKAIFHHVAKTLPSEKANETDKFPGIYMCNDQM